MGALQYCSRPGPTTGVHCHATHVTPGVPAIVLIALLAATALADPFECSDAAGSSYLTASSGCGSGDVARLLAVLQACEPGSAAGAPAVPLNVGCAGGPGNTTGVLASSTGDAAARARLQDALTAVRAEYDIPAGTPADNGVDEGWVVPFGGFVTARTTLQCSAYARSLSDAVRSFEDGTFAGCEWTTVTTTATSTATTTATTTATFTTTTTPTSTATTTATTTAAADRGRFKCTTTSTNETYIAVATAATCSVQVVRYFIVTPGPSLEILV
jgi:hypothetical protein